MFFLLQNQRIGVEQVRPSGAWHQWDWGSGRERGRRMNVVQIMYTHVCKSKNDTFGNHSRKDEGERWRGEFKYDISDTF
jgi:hypothetical protein